MNGSKSKKFHLGDILSVTTGRLLGPNKMKGLYKLVSHLAGRDVWTHELALLRNHAANAILHQHRSLPISISWKDAKTFKDKKTTSEERIALVKKIVSDLIPIYGEYLEITPMPEAHQLTKEGPISTLIKMRKRAYGRSPCEEGIIVAVIPEKAASSNVKFTLLRDQ